MVNVASSLIHVEIVHVGRRYSVAFFSRSYLESWRRFEMVEARGLQRREEKGREKKSVATTVEEREKKPGRSPVKDWEGKGILEEITRSKDDGGGGEVRVNRGFYKNYPQACGEAAVADWIGRIHLSSWELSTNVPHRASFPFNNNDSFVANCHNPRS